MKKLLILALALAVAVGGAYYAYGKLAPTAKTAESAGQGTADAAKDAVPAPDFTVYDKDGNKYMLSDFKGQPILLNFWASWCGPCKGEMPDIETVYGEYKDTVVFLMVNMTDGSRETVATGNQYVADQGYTFPVYYDTDQSAASAYGVTSIPSNVFIDADFNVVAGYRGALGLEDFRSNLDVIAATATASSAVTAPECSLPT